MIREIVRKSALDRRKRSGNAALLTVSPRQALPIMTYFPHQGRIFMSINAIIGGAAAAPESPKAVAMPRTSGPDAEAATVSTGLLAPTSHASRMGVAAYLSVLNPPPSASMHTEA